MRKQTNDIIAGLTSPEEKLAAIYHWVATSIVWSGKNRLYADKEVNDVLESKTGSNAEISFLLLSMLKSAGIQADPVILSTRDNGKIQDTYPIESQFNYVLAQATIGSQNFLIDATDPVRPMSLLPPKVLNVKGLVVNSDSIKWVQLSTQKRELKSSISSIKVHEDGSISGTLEDSYAEYRRPLCAPELAEERESRRSKRILQNGGVGNNDRFTLGQRQGQHRPADSINRFHLLPQLCPEKRRLDVS